MSLQRVHRQLKEITEEIRVTETDLLDVASLINIEIIQIDREMIDIKQELIKRKMKIPRERLSSCRNFEALNSTPLPDTGVFVASLEDTP